MILDNFGSICYNGDSSRELATIGDTMTISILIQGDRGRSGIILILIFKP